MLAIVADTLHAQGGQSSPFLHCIEAKFFPSNLTVSSEDWGMTLSMDGDRLAVGGKAGRAKVFFRSGHSWSEEALFTAPPGTGFGTNVALDGDTLVIGNPYGSPTIYGAGVCHVYVRTGAGWALQADLVPLDSITGDSFGATLALEGDTLLVGAPRRQDLGVDSGAAYVFSRSSGVWSQRSKLLAVDGQAGDFFGGPVAVSGDTLLVGAAFDDDQGTDTGSAYPFRRSGAIWIQEPKLLAPAATVLPNDRFGSCLGLDSGCAVIGSQARQSVAGVAVHHFVRTGTTWSYVSTTRPGAWGGDGLSLALDGTRMAVGVPGWYPVGQASHIGRVYVYELTAQTWNLLGSVSRDPGLPSASFAWSVAIQGDRYAVGSITEPFPGTYGPAGLATVYVLMPTPVTYCTAKLASIGCAPAIDARGVPSGSAVSGFDVLCTDVINNQPGLLVYGTSGRATVPFAGGTLCVASPVRRTIGTTSYGTPAPALDCTGVYSLDWNGWAAGLLGGSPPAAVRVAGTTVHAQWWGRDPGFPPPFNVTLSDALEFVVCP